MALFFVFLSAASRSWQQVQPIYAKTVTQMHIEKEKCKKKRTGGTAVRYPVTLLCFLTQDPNLVLFFNNL